MLKEPLIPSARVIADDASWSEVKCTALSKDQPAAAADWVNRWPQPLIHMLETPFGQLRASGQLQPNRQNTVAVEARLS